MRIALGTDDTVTLKRERFGDSVHFMIVTIEENRLVATELRSNPYTDPTLENKPPKILSLLNDCDIFVGRSWRTGSFSLFTDNGKTVFLCNEENLEIIISHILKGDFSLFKRFDSKEQKFIPF